MSRPGWLDKLHFAILAILLISLVNTASALANNNIPFTMTPGEEITRTLSFSGAYARLFATADATGSASLWVTPRRIDFGAIDPGETIERDYTVSIPKSQKPGYYEVIWKFSCKYTDGSTCSSSSNVVLQITVKDPSSASLDAEYEYITMNQGGEQSKYLTFSAGSDDYGLYAWAEASGNAASWVTPGRIDFGVIASGDSINKYYTLKVPKYQKPGNYELIWTWGCGYRSGKSCNPVPGSTIYKITIQEGRMPVYTPSSGSTDSDIALGIFFLIFFLVFFIVGLYILVWVIKDANKRGTSGALWGIILIFSGIIGLILYFIARPKGNIVSCGNCGKQKLETLTQCPHCKKSTTTLFRPAPAPMTAPIPVTPVRPEAGANDLKKEKEKLRKIEELLEKLDERLAQGDITEGRYKELSEQYKEEAEKLKNIITEKELLKEVGL